MMRKLKSLLRRSDCRRFGARSITNSCQCIGALALQPEYSSHRTTEKHCQLKHRNLWRRWRERWPVISGIGGLLLLTANGPEVNPRGFRSDVDHWNIL